MEFGRPGGFLAGVTGTEIGGILEELAGGDEVGGVLLTGLFARPELPSVGSVVAGAAGRVG